MEPSGEGTGDLGGERASRDVFVIKLDHDVIIPTGGGKVGHCARPIFVVLTRYLSFRWTLYSERQTTCMDSVPVMLALPTDFGHAATIKPTKSWGCWRLPSPVSLVTIVNVASVFTVP